jgi:hypothetical protein
MSGPKHPEGPARWERRENIPRLSGNAGRSLLAAVLDVNPHTLKWWESGEVWPLQDVADRWEEMLSRFE